MVKPVMSHQWLNVFRGSTYSATPFQLKETSVTAILVLSCLPLALFMSVLAHEVFYCCNPNPWSYSAKHDVVVFSRVYYSLPLSRCTCNVYMHFTTLTPSLTLIFYLTHTSCYVEGASCDINSRLLLHYYFRLCMLTSGWMQQCQICHALLKKGCASLWHFCG